MKTQFSRLAQSLFKRLESHLPPEYRQGDKGNQVIAQKDLSIFGWGVMLCLVIGCLWFHFFGVPSFLSLPSYCPAWMVFLSLKGLGILSAAFVGSFWPLFALNNMHGEMSEIMKVILKLVLFVLQGISILFLGIVSMACSLKEIILLELGTDVGFEIVLVLFISNSVVWFVLVGAVANFFCRSNRVAYFTKLLDHLFWREVK